MARSQNRRELERQRATTNGLLRGGANASWREIVGDLGVAVAFLGPLLLMVVVSGLWVGRAFAHATLVDDVRTASLAVGGVFLAFGALGAFVLRRQVERVRRVLTLVGLALSALLVVAHAVLLLALAVAPAATEATLARHQLGAYPCEDHYRCEADLGTQTEWWLAFAARHSGTPQSDAIVPRIVAQLGRGVPLDTGLASLLAVYRADPEGMVALLEALSVAAESESVAAPTREAIRQGLASLGAVGAPAEAPLPHDSTPRG